MCGIVWYLSQRLAADEIDSQCLTEFMKIRHRGPDNTSFLTHNKHFLGAHRLAILNPQADGNQPLVTNNTYLICNGQIYNYSELNNDEYELRTDVDIILQLFIRNNVSENTAKLEELALQLDGDFAFVVLKDDAVYHSKRPYWYKTTFLWCE